MNSIDFDAVRPMVAVLCDLDGGISYISDDGSYIEVKESESEGVWFMELHSPDYKTLAEAMVTVSDDGVASFYKVDRKYVATVQYSVAYPQNLDDIVFSSFGDAVYSDGVMLGSSLEVSGYTLTVVKPFGDRTDELIVHVKGSPDVPACPKFVLISKNRIPRELSVSVLSSLEKVCGEGPF